MTLMPDELEERRQVTARVQAKHLTEDCEVCPFSLVCLTDNATLLSTLFREVGAYCVQCQRLWARDAKETHRSYRCKNPSPLVSNVSAFIRGHIAREWICYDCVEETKLFREWQERKWPKGEP